MILETRVISMPIRSNSSANRLLGIIINISGNQSTNYIGTKYWNDPGAFHNGFKGFVSYSCPTQS